MGRRRRRHLLLWQGLDAAVVVAATRAAARAAQRIVAATAAATICFLKLLYILWWVRGWSFIKALQKRGDAGERPRRGAVKASELCRRVHKYHVQTETAERRKCVFVYNLLALEDLVHNTYKSYKKST